MKLFHVAALLAVSLEAHASQSVLDQSNSGLELGQNEFRYLQGYPDYNLDLGDKRLVQLDPSGPLVLLSELEKVCSGRLLPSSGIH